MTTTEQQFRRYSYSYWRAHPDEAQAIKREHLARLRLGKAGWNNWAQEFARYITNNNIQDARIDLAELKIAPSDFGGYVFPAYADFGKVTFTADAYFYWATFAGGAYFDEATFAGDAYFREATFTGTANFNNATFAGNADFTSTTIKALRLERCKFANQVPDFRYAASDRPPYISNMQVPDCGNSNAVNVLRYRKLKELAIATHDHQKELEFFGYELKAARGVEITGFKVIPVYLYQWLSNFGQSLTRPLVLVFATIAVMWGINTTLISRAMAHHLPSAVQISADTWHCPDMQANRTTLIRYSLIYTIATSLPITVASEKAKEKTIRCLFNDEIPPLKHKIMAVIQLLLSLSGMVLFGLSLRNRFKIQ